MNEHLKALLSTLKLNGNIRIRLEKTFEQKEAVTAITFFGMEHGKKLDVSKEDLPALLQICEAIPTLETLAIIGQDLDNESILMISIAISKMHKLRVLHLESNKISDTETEHITRCIQRHPSLETLYLHGEQIGDVSVESVVRTLLGNCRMHRLSIKGKAITEKSIGILSKLISIDRLDQISIGCDFLSAESCRILGEVIVRNNKLTTLVIETNRTDGLNFLLDAIRINSFLKDIIIFDDSLTEAEATKINQELIQITIRNKQKQLSILADEILEFVHQKLHLSTHSFDAQALSAIVEVTSKLYEARLTSKPAEEMGAVAGVATFFPTRRP